MVLKQSTSEAHVSDKETEVMAARKEFELSRLRYVKCLNNVRKPSVCVN